VHRREPRGRAAAQTGTAWPLLAGRYDRNTLVSWIRYSTWGLRPPRGEQHCIDRCPVGASGVAKGLEKVYKRRTQRAAALPR
jgi:hypothetical protein